MDYKNIVNLNYLEPDDTFRFACNCCGQCCKEREDILLSAYDIMRLQGYLDISFEELLLTYCEMYIGKESELPIVRLRTEARCPFLLHGKCYVQDAKPTVCLTGKRSDIFSRNMTAGRATQNIPCESGWNHSDRTAKNAVFFGEIC